MKLWGTLKVMIFTVPPTTWRLLTSFGARVTFRWFNMICLVVTPPSRPDSAPVCFSWCCQSLRTSQCSISNTEDQGVSAESQQKESMLKNVARQLFQQRQQSEDAVWSVYSRQLFLSGHAHLAGKTHTLSAQNQPVGIFFFYWKKRDYVFKWLHVSSEGVSLKSVTSDSELMA